MAARSSTCDSRLRRRNRQVVEPNTDKWTKELSQLVQPSETHPTLQCYTVSLEVGKVGNESPTFIEPISERKDGIVAMFASQGSQKSKSSPVKRKRSASPPPAKKQRTTKVQEEGDSEIEFVGYGEFNPKDESLSPVRKPSKRAPSSSPSKLSSRGKEKKKNTPDPSSRRITDFFKK